MSISKKMVQADVVAVLLLSSVVTLVSTTPARRPGRRGSQNHSWMCPSVVCSPVSPFCQEVEYFTMAFSFYEHGQRVDVRCESCSYCLDSAVFSDARKRRSLSGRHSQQRKGCPASLRCPGVSANCEKVRMTEILVRGHHCKRCPACYDNTYVNSIE